MTTHPPYALQWQAPAPLWGRFGSGPRAAPTGRSWSRTATGTPAVTAGQDQFRPAILRFASDEFMERMLATLARDPAGLADLLARPETWRSPPQPADQTPPDPTERVPLPQVTRAAGLGLSLRRPRTAVAPVPSTRPVTEQTRQRTLPLKLYQPAHQRHYLVSASLACAHAGLADRAVTRGASQQVGYVIRRLLAADPQGNPDGEPREYAYVKGTDAARWQRVNAAGDDAVLAPGEEILPVFPLAYADAAGHTRTLWTGLIPVGRREEYIAVPIVTASTALLEAQRAALAAPLAAPGSAEDRAARLTQFEMEVAEPWKGLIRAVYQARDSLAETAVEPEDEPAETDDARRERIRTLNLQWQHQSWLILLDLADFLAVHLPQVWQAIGDQGASAADLGAPGNPLADLDQWLGKAVNEPLLTAVIGAAPGKPAKKTLRDALAAIRAAGVGERLESAESLYTESTKAAGDWPGFHFLLAGLDGTLAGARPLPEAAGAFLALSRLPGGPAVPLDDSAPPWLAAQVAADAVDRLTALVGQALDTNAKRTPAPQTQTQGQTPPLPFALQVRDALAATAQDSGWFAVRFVYLDRDCGPLQPPLLSAPTQCFQLASFFDPDAPARPIRITLPRDTSPAGLRRHSRGTAFVISDILCGQIQRAKGLGLGDLVRSVLPWPLHKDLSLGSAGPCDVGMICSLSIPIITICALILLIIIVSLLDFIFHWLPYFILCFPVPKLKGKGAAP